MTQKRRPNPGMGMNGMRMRLKEGPAWALKGQGQGLQTAPPMERLRPAGLGPMAAQPP